MFLMFMCMSSFAVACVNFASEQRSGIKVWRTSTGNICVDNTLAVKEMKIGGDWNEGWSRDARYFYSFAIGVE